MMNVRCGRRWCRTRKTLRKHPDLYKRRPKCRVCGGNLNYDPEVYRRHRAEKCECGGINWPHRISTILSRDEFCRVHALVDVESIMWAREMDARSIRRMKPDDECPF